MKKAVFKKTAFLMFSVSLDLASFSGLFHKPVIHDYAWAGQPESVLRRTK